MHRCPPELILHIATLACTDDGRTGCALSEVSRFVRDSSKRARYRSLAIRSYARLLALGELLANPPNPFVVRHLFVSVDIPGYGPWRTRNQEGLLNALERVFVHASPTLFTLVVDRPYLMKSLKIKFPVLVDLSISKFRPEPQVPDPRTFFPALRRLHISNCSDLEEDELWRDLAAYAPTLTHLRLSRVENDGKLSQMICLLLRVPVATENANQMVILDGTPKLTYACVRVSWCASEEMLAAMREVEEDITRNCDGIIFQLADDGCRRYSGEEAFSDWLSLVNGGDGPWDSPEENTGLRASGTSIS